jgi:type II secretory pathway pseudopilin PulG
MIRQECRQYGRHNDGKRSKLAGEQGFTLIETTVAMVVMMIVALGAASAFVYAVSNNSGANDRQLSMAVAQKRMEWLRGITLDETTADQAYAYPGGGLKETAAPVVETTTSGGRTFQITTTITDLDTDTNSDANGAIKTIKVITILVRPANTAGWSQTSTVFGSVTLTTERAVIHLGPNI